MPQKYPGFIIDNSRRSKQSKHTDDYLVCVDKEVGFIARLYRITKSQVEAHNKQMEASPEAYKFDIIVGADLAIVLEVLEFLHPPLLNITKFNSLKKKAIKAYTHGVIASVKGDGSDLDRQIAAVKQMEQNYINVYDESVEVNGKAATDGIIKNLHGAVDSLELLKNMMSKYKQ